MAKYWLRFFWISWAPLTMGDNPLRAMIESLRNYDDLYNGSDNGSDNGFGKQV